MKLSYNTSRAKISSDEFRFAKQCGCKGVVLALANYNQNWFGRGGGVPFCEPDDPFWNYDSLKGISDMLRAEGLEWFAIENFNPADWYDILLDGPQKYKQIDKVKRIIENAAKVGVQSFGYNFSLTAVYGREMKNTARGGAPGMYFDASNPKLDVPIPNGEIWNVQYDKDATGNMPVISNEELWERCKWFLEQIIPVAEEYGIKMCAHPEDPPVPRLRGNARLIYKLDMFQRLVDLVPSPCSGIELCLGTMQEMDDGEIYDTVGSLAAQKKVAYVHLRNVRGKVPHYEEVFIDEGDLDVIRVLKTLNDNGFHGAVIPDHVPDMICADRWHASMAYALGYIKAILQALGCDE